MSALKGRWIIDGGFNRWIGYIASFIPLPFQGGSVGSIFFQTLKRLSIFRCRFAASFRPERAMGYRRQFSTADSKLIEP